MTTTLLQISGMSCQSCVAHIEKSEAVSGVTSVAVDLQAGRATVDHEGADEQKMVAAVTKEGYRVQIIPPSAEVNSSSVPPTR